MYFVKNAKCFIICHEKLVLLLLCILLLLIVTTTNAHIWADYYQSVLGKSCGTNN